MKNSQFPFLVILAICILSMFHPNAALAQKRAFSINDTSYYISYPDMITMRYLFSKKYTAFNLNGTNRESDLRYRPNTKITMGVGATYHVLSINIAYGFGFLNPDDGKGKTKYLDLQSRLYLNKWTMDFYGQFYKGYYLFPKGFNSLSADSYYQRPDMIVNLYGVTMYRVLNYRKFSFRAAFLQNEWQKKSAGTVLLGGEMNYGIMRADSSFVPLIAVNSYPHAGINNVHFFCFGPGAGYAYTLVVKQHFFMTGSVTANLNFGFSTEKNDFTSNNKVYVNPVSIFRFAAGYYSNAWAVSANWISNMLPVGGLFAANSYFLQTGNYRLVFTKKIKGGKKMQKMLNKIDKAIYSQIPSIKPE